MGLAKKKIGAFLLAVVLFSAATFVYAAQPDAGETAKPLVGKSDSLYGSETDTDLDAGGLFFRMILMVLMVIVLGVAAVYLSKKVLPKLSGLPGKRIQVIETVHLGQRKAMHLIKVGTQTLLIGSTNENITKLADVTGQLAEDDLPAEQ